MRIVIRQSPYYDSHSPQYSLSKNNTNSELNSKFVLFTSGAANKCVFELLSFERRLGIEIKGKIALTA